MLTRHYRATRTGHRANTLCAAEAVEGRVLLSSYTVTTLGDDAGVVTFAGPGAFNATTLRAALNAANAAGGADVKHVVVDEAFDEVEQAPPEDHGAEQRLARQRHVPPRHGPPQHPQ